MIRRQIYDYFFLLLLAVVSYGILKLLSPFAGPLLAALLCAVTFYPMHEALQRRFPKLPPSFQAAVTDSLVFIFFVTPVILLSWALIQESTSLIAVANQGSATVAQWREGNILESTPWMSHVRFFLTKTFGLRRAEFRENFIGWVNVALQHLSQTGPLLAKHLILLVVDLLIMLFALFFMFRDGKTLSRAVQNLIPLRQENKEQLTARIHDIAIGLARGLILTSLIQGLVATAGYLIVGADGAVLLGVLTALSGLVPVIGTLGIWVPASAFYFLKGSFMKGTFLLIWGSVVIVGLMDTLVRPYLVGKTLKLPLFALFLALVGGVEVWGGKGIILGPLVIAIAPVLLEIYRHRYLRGEDGSQEMQHVLKDGGLEPPALDVGSELIGRR
jgi:predicted PurR-regulated permease PerM